MNGLRVIPTWKHGQERLYVCRTDGRNIAWYDRRAARVNLLSEDRREDVLDVLGPFLTGPVTVGPPPVPTSAELARLTLPPDDDLAPNRPGETLLVALDRDPDPPRRLRPDPRRRSLAAEQAVGETLDGLEAGGWRTLHSIALPGGDRIHHLLIGPGGLYCVRAVHAHKQRVLIDDPMVAVGRRPPRPLLRYLRADADRAAYALTADVRPVLAPVGACGIEVTAPLREARVLPAEELYGLARAGGVLKPAEVEALHAVARNRHTWARV
ncbi:nuclease-related domain-containing protein [Streptomyces sp. CRN 30]|uniref:nuclease-related domain-containing protein n=1 Tax=Streptomyces sp. CRN 30 TaxID=3075613 RepID=UPI002A836B33|nr:nuclease-related domain-containing protein [Streptomyces sp. CRN 30]